MIQSTIPLIYDAESRESAIIKRKYSSFTFDFDSKQGICKFENYAVLPDGTLKSIGSLDFRMPFDSVQLLFQMLQDSILVTENINTEVEKLIIIAGLHVCKTSLNKDFTTSYGGQPEDWEICPGVLTV